MISRLEVEGLVNRLKRHPGVKHVAHVHWRQGVYIELWQSYHHELELMGRDFCASEEEQLLFRDEDLEELIRFLDAAQVALSTYKERVPEFSFSKNADRGFYYTEDAPIRFEDGALVSGKKIDG